MFKSAFFLAVLVITFSGCQKVLEYYNYKEPKPSTGCRVKRITSSNLLQFDTTSIEYHGNGMPASVTVIYHDAEVFFTSVYVVYFTYDHLNRLVSDASDFAYRDQHYYAYEGNSLLPVRDSVRGAYINYVQHFEYDAKGRIIKITRRDYDHFVSPEETPPADYKVVYKYFYDVRGNRQEDVLNPHYPGPLKYSDKPGLYSLHPVWQLIHHDYSRNSLANQATFNSKGLPSSLNSPTPSDFPSFLDLYRGDKIEYDCED